MNVRQIKKKRLDKSKYVCSYRNHIIYDMSCRDGCKRSTKKLSKYFFFASVKITFSCLCVEHLFFVCFYEREYHMISKYLFDVVFCFIRLCICFSWFLVSCLINHTIRICDFAHDAWHSMLSWIYSECSSMILWAITIQCYQNNHVFLSIYCDIFINIFLFVHLFWMDVFVRRKTSRKTTLHRDSFCNSHWK